MEIRDAIFLIKPHHFAVIRETPKITISFENGKWMKKFDGEFSSVHNAITTIKKLGFRSYKIKLNGKWVRNYFSPWWKANEFDTDWKRVYKEFAK